MKLHKLFVISGLLVIFFGIYLVNLRYSPKKLEFKNLESSKISSSTVSPVMLAIPSLGIQNGIYKSKIDDGKWETTTKGVSYLVSSPNPGERGNSIIYGHNWPSLLGNLTKIKPGEKIEILMSNGEKRIFIVKFTSVVDPNQTYILNATKDTRITIYTCTGFLDSKRFVATATLEN